MHFLEELGWDEELGQVLVPGTLLWYGYCKRESKFKYLPGTEETQLVKFPLNFPIKVENAASQKTTTCRSIQHDGTRCAVPARCHCVWWNVCQVW